MNILGKKGKELYKNNCLIVYLLGKYFFFSKKMYEKVKYC